MILEKYKRITLDIIASATAWILFFAYRKLVIEESFLELSATLLYGTIGVTLFWTTIYSLSGTYKDVRRVSRLNELYRTLTQTITGSFCIFFFLIIFNLSSKKSYISRRTFLYLGLICMFFGTPCM